MLARFGRRFAPVLALGCCCCCGGGGGCRCRPVFFVVVVVVVAVVVVVVGRCWPYLGAGLPLSWP